MIRPGEKVQIWWCMDWRCKCWHVGAILGESHSWRPIERPSPNEQSVFARDDEWDVFYWTGPAMPHLSSDFQPRWVLRNPDYEVIGVNPNLSPEQIPEAILWATQAIEVLGGKYIE